ncbi:acetate kinase, partial [Bacillus sp. SIMBA_074]
AVLVVNSGSSSFKYQLIDSETEESLASGLVERIGEKSGHTTHRGPDGTTERTLEIPDHTAGFRAMLDAFAAEGPSLEENPLAAVG